MGHLITILSDCNIHCNATLLLINHSVFHLITDKIFNISFFTRPVLLLSEHPITSTASHDYFIPSF